MGAPEIVILLLVVVVVLGVGLALRVARLGRSSADRRDDNAPRA